MSYGNSGDTILIFYPPWVQVFGVATRDPVSFQSVERNLHYQGVCLCDRAGGNYPVPFRSSFLKENYANLLATHATCFLCAVLKLTVNSVPVAFASLSRVLRVTPMYEPLSSRDMTCCVVPIRRASSACDSFNLCLSFAIS